MISCEGFAAYHESPISRVGQPLAAERVRGAPYAQARPVEHVRVDHGGAHIFVTQQLLHSADVVALAQ